MRVLITWGSKRGGTEGIARTIGDVLRAEGDDVEVLPPKEAGRARGFDAAIVGGALYANRWHHEARGFVHRREQDLRRVPVWFFSSGPLDDSADREAIAPVQQVQVLMERIGAQGHTTFGGRLTPDAKGFPASAMARKVAGDYRNTRQIRAWAEGIAHALPGAQPGRVIAQPGRSAIRVFTHALVGWLLCASVMGFLLRTASQGAAFALHAVVAPLIFALLAHHYFAARGARDPLLVAAAFAGFYFLLEFVIVAGLLPHGLAVFRSFAGTALPLLLIFGVTWATGELMSMMPFRRPEHGRPATNP